MVKRTAESGYGGSGARGVTCMESARIYLSGQNLLTLKKTWGDNAFTGSDPETPNFAYPIPRAFTFGIQVAF